MTRLLILSFIITIVCFSCEEEKIGKSEVSEVIKNEIVIFEKGNIPILLEEYLAENDITIFGETHYVQQHQEFISLLLPELSALGYRVILDEQFHCFNWMIEDYINDDIEELPEFLLYFNEAIIESIKDFNRSVEESSRFQLAYMDVNHWKSNFIRCIEEIENIIGTQNVFVPVKNAQVDSESYRDNLQLLMSQLESDSIKYTSLWGTKWYKRLSQIIPVEILSSEFRTTQNRELRESVMYHNITKVIRDNNSSKFLINTGMFHGQKNVYMGENLNRIGKRLTANFAKTFSMAFIGMRGERKQSFTDENNILFNLSQSTSADDIVHQIYELAPNEMLLLPLDNNIFTDENIKITYIQGTTVNAPIGKQFDAIIVYPEISTLESMSTYNWQ